MQLKGIVVSNVGGWHSEKGIENTWDDDCIKELMYKVQLAKDEVIRRTVKNTTDAHFNNWESETGQMLIGKIHIMHPMLT